MKEQISLKRIIGTDPRYFWAKKEKKKYMTKHLNDGLN